MKQVALSHILYTLFSFMDASYLVSVFDNYINLTCNPRLKLYFAANQVRGKDLAHLRREKAHLNQGSSLLAYMKP